MTRQLYPGVVLACLLTGCGTDSTPEGTLRPAENNNVTFFVDGMMEQFNIL
ncbi:MAG: hypothetical protein VB858_07745 [Planctomycetaceae bacterium]